MRVTWLWALGPDDESEPPRAAPQARSSARRTPRSRIDTMTTHHRTATEGTTRHV